MKIFMSHSSKSKLFVKELRRYLPAKFNLWIDERELLIGNLIEENLKQAIELECDFLILIIDSFSINSGWVQKEINWALKKEESLNRAFLLPIVIDEEAFTQINNEIIKSKKYIKCLRQEDIYIEAAAKSLTSEILGHLCDMIDKKNYQNVIESANEISLKFESELKKILMPYRTQNPLSILEISNLLGNKIPGLNLKSVGVYDFLIKLRDSGFLKGIYFDDEIIYIEKESYHYKAEINKLIKRKIAKKAFSMVHPGHKIAIDGGSTTYELAKLISNSLIQGTLYDLTIVSNSILIVNELTTALSKLNLRDNNNVCTIYMIGGKARPTSLTLVPDDDEALREISNMATIFEKIGIADVGFLGTNGVKPNVGFSNKNRFELNAKNDIIRYCKEKVILADPTKFLVEQDEVFAKFSDSLKVITSGEGEYKDTIEAFKKQIENSNTELILV